MKPFYITTFIVSLFIINLTSCVSYKQLKLIHEDEKPFSDSSYSHPLLNYKIQPGDILNIKVRSTTDNELEIFKQEYSGATGSQINPASLYINGYIVDKNGDIELPLIGKINVINLTLNEIDKKLKEKLETFVNYVTVSTKLVSYRVSVLGEVRSPGTILVYNSNINILQALAEAGDITEVGNRSKIKLIRKTKTGTSFVRILNASSQDIIKSEFFYLYPNDIIYVEPLKAKTLKVNSPAISITVSFVTILFLILNFTKK